MNWKIAGLILAVVVAIATVILIARNRAHPSFTVTLRVTVTPGEKLVFAISQAKTARFKYLMSKKSGVKPFFAQKLSVEAVPKSPQFLAQLKVESKDEARQYIDGFVETLQSVCGGQVQLEISAQSIH